MTRRRTTSSRLLALGVLGLVSVVLGQQMDIPEKLDPFLELLFETSECETVVADPTFLVVDTRKCKPFTCNFPFEVCMRPSNLINEEKSNQCRPIPDTCITAANAGRPISRAPAPTTTLSPTPPSTRILVNLKTGTASPVDPNGDDLEGDFEEPGDDGDPETDKMIPVPRTELPNPRLRPNRLHKSPICEQQIPNGRFCGFQLKFTFNRATGNCEQFWFPGCRTEETNDNLFDGLDECRGATRHCNAQRPPAPRVLPSPTPPEAPIPFLGSFGGGAPTDGGNQFSRGFMEWAGSALGNNGAAVPAAGRSATGRGDYGGGDLGNGGAVTQPPNLIRFIANTIQNVGSGNQKGGAANGGASVFTNLLQQFG